MLPRRAFLGAVTAGLALPRSVAAQDVAAPSNDTDNVLMALGEEARTTLHRAFFTGLRSEDARRLAAHCRILRAANIDRKLTPEFRRALRRPAVRNAILDLDPSHTVAIEDDAWVGGGSGYVPTREQRSAALDDMLQHGFSHRLQRLAQVLDTKAPSLAFYQPGAHFAPRTVQDTYIPGNDNSSICTALFFDQVAFQVATLSLNYWASIASIAAPEIGLIFGVLYVTTVSVRYVMC